MATTKFRLIALLFPLIAAAAQAAAPVWRMNPIVMPATPVGSAFTFDLSAYAASPTGSPIQFSFVSGPAWLKLSPAGALMGTPNLSDVGAFTLTVSATDDDSTSVNKVTGVVLELPPPPVALLTCANGETATYVGKSASADDIYSCPASASTR